MNGEIIKWTNNWINALTIKWINQTKLFSSTDLNLTLNFTLDV